jgi:hypothetical protein
MAKIAKASVISHIEYIIDAPSAAIERHSWQAQGVECSRDRHRFSGQSYAFTIDVLRVRFVQAGRIIWQLILVTKGSRAADGDIVLRQAKWLKLIHGKASEVTSWIQRWRTQKLQQDKRNAQPAKS